MGEKTNCISAQAVLNTPKISAARGVSANYVLNELRQHRDDDAEGGNVDEHDGENEADRCLARRGERGRSLHSGIFVNVGEMRL